MENTLVKLSNMFSESEHQLFLRNMESFFVTAR